ncbi:unnamed protein product [Linum trigynum]|uniref:RNase H type-1 domain-containing protein n=1 Tax=Linum trigynum TaxID=586398 RepID=A0AAV2EWZ7_9ROSI
MMFKREIRPAEIAKLKTISFALEVVEMKGYFQVEIESNCLKVVSKLKGDNASLTEEGWLSEEIRTQAQYLGHIKWIFAKRECNKAAHIIAHTLCN